MRSLFNILIVLFSITFSNRLIAATYYFSTSGSDLNNGLSSATPKKSIAAANELMGGGNIILFKRGDTWYLPQGTIIMDNRSNFTLDAYGNGNGKRPIIAGMALLDDIWTYEGKNVWSHPTVYNDALRVFVNNISRISLNDKANNNPVLTDLNTTDEYWFDQSTSKLYIQHTSAKTAPKNVVMIPAWPAPPIVSMFNTTNVTIRNIEFWGGGNVSTIRIYAPSSNILIDRCIVTRANLIGIFAVNLQQTMDVVENLVIQDCIIDKAWTLAENNLKPSVILDGDGITFAEGVKQSIIRNCKITNFGHDGISVLVTTYTTGIYGVKFNKIEGNDISAGNSAYMHAFSVEGYKDMAMYNIFKRNYCHDFSSANTIGGNTNFVFSNIFANVRVSPLPQHSQAPHAMNVATWSIKDKTGILSALECKNNWISNNTIYNTDTYSFKLDRSDANSDSASLSGNQLHNNLLLNWGMDTAFALDDPSGIPPLRLGIRIINNVRAGVNFFRNNNFWVDWDTSTTRRAVLYRTRFYSVSQFNNCLECGPGNVTGNTQLSPKLGRFYDLTSNSSALLRSGGYLYKSDIIAAGLPAAEFVDYYGKPWRDANISVGAIQY